MKHRFRSSETAGPRLVVLGSVNMDLVARVAALPRPGETVAGRSLETIPGGKGANQAVAAARLGARTAMVARVGDDDFGPRLVRGLVGAGVDAAAVRVTPGCSSGVALISVEDAGQNSIVIVAGANGRLTPADVAANAALIASASALLLQLEVPLETVAAAARLARRAGVTVVLDPAPAPSRPLPAALFRVDLLSPNQTEAEALTGIRVDTPADAGRAARVLHARGARHVVVKLGALGALHSDGRTAVHIPARRVKPVDTTAAGDAFTAALALAWAEGRPPAEAVRFACAAGTLATLTFGAQPAMPTRAQVEAFLSGAKPAAGRRRPSNRKGRAP